MVMMVVMVVVVVSAYRDVWFCFGGRRHGVKTFLACCVASASVYGSATLAALG